MGKNCSSGDCGGHSESGRRLFRVCDRDGRSDGSDGSGGGWAKTEAVVTVVVTVNQRSSGDCGGHSGVRGSGDCGGHSESEGQWWSQ